MFGIGSSELLVILVVALIVIGPSKLPEIMRVIGKGMAEFRRVSNDVRSTLEAEIDRADQEHHQAESNQETTTAAATAVGEPSAAAADGSSKQTPAKEGPTA